MTGAKARDALACQPDLFTAGIDPIAAGCFHTHPAFAVRLVLWGGYIEEMESGDQKTWRPGRAGLIRPELSHRVALLLNGKASYSIWLRAPCRYDIELRGPGWPKEEQRA